ncbi:MAG: DUF4332 domain-containing protein [Planctomycetota bacterium]
MSRLLTILRAAHCRSTHHYFAIDALSRIQSPQGQQLGQLLLKYHDEYLVGAKAPDSSFKDFRNHVLHVGDNCWGGAINACEDWWQRAVKALNEGKWKTAAFACGVLSHYFTDPIMPLHTGSSDKESVVHRPMEWSVCKSYDEIFKLAKERSWNFTLVNDSPEWLSQAVKAAATASHQHYDRLIDIYDLKKGCKNPPEGLNDESREILAEMFAIAVGGWSQILGRLANETTSAMPEVSLSLTTFLATIDMPLAWIVRKIADTNEKLAVKQIFREFESTGKLVKNLPRESKVVRAEREKEREAIIAANTAATQPAPAKPKTEKPPAASTSAPATIPTQSPEKEATLNLTDDLVDAPSIGPKTVKRFQKIGIHTVAEFLNGSPNEMAKQLNTRWITPETLVEWQDQARLVCDVPALCGYKAQLLVAVGCRDQKSLAASNAFDLAKAIEQYCQTLEGKRILRRSKLPSKDDIAGWITSASHPSAKAA